MLSVGMGCSLKGDVARCQAHCGSMVGPSGLGLGGGGVAAAGAGSAVGASGGAAATVVGAEEETTSSTAGERATSSVSGGCSRWRAVPTLVTMPAARVTATAVVVRGKKPARLGVLFGRRRGGGATGVRTRLGK